MLSISSIKEANREAAAQACRRGLKPFVFDEGDVKALQTGDTRLLRGLPYVGDYLAPYFVRVHLPEIDTNTRGVYEGDNAGYGAYFVDSSGFGREDEPALTVEEFCQRVQPGYAYAIVEAGQFQVKIGVFRYTA